MWLTCDLHVMHVHVTCLTSALAYLWEVRTMDLPTATSSVRAFQRWRRALGSIPVVGSSWFWIGNGNTRIILQLPTVLTRIISIVHVHPSKDWHVRTIEMILVSTVYNFPHVCKNGPHMQVCTRTHTHTHTHTHIHTHTHTSRMMGGLPTRAIAVLSFLLFPPLQKTQAHTQ